VDDHEHLTDKQCRYAENIATGMDSRAAARSDGYSESFSKVVAHRFRANPAIVKAVEDIRKKGRDMAAYGLVEAMEEAEDVCAFAKLHKNAMAYCKATELRAKLSGLLIDRVEIMPIDLRGALLAAQSRVLTAIDITPRQPCEDGLAVQGGARWETRLAGDPLPSDPERACPSQAGQAD
jgi:hypothetical protein